jgi:hypothetical protein
MKDLAMWPRKAKHIIVLLAVMAGPSARCAEMGAAAIDAAEPSKKTLSNEKPSPCLRPSNELGCGACCCERCERHSGRFRRRLTMTADCVRTTSAGQAGEFY